MKGKVQQLKKEKEWEHSRWWWWVERGLRGAASSPPPGSQAGLARPCPCEEHNEIKAQQYHWRTTEGGCVVFLQPALGVAVRWQRRAPPSQSQERRLRDPFLEASRCTHPRVSHLLHRCQHLRQLPSGPAWRWRAPTRKHSAPAPREPRLMKRGMIERERPTWPQGGVQIRRLPPTSAHTPAPTPACDQTRRKQQQKKKKRRKLDLF